MLSDKRVSVSVRLTIRDCGAPVEIDPFPQNLNHHHCSSQNPDAIIKLDAIAHGHKWKYMFIERELHQIVSETTESKFPLVNSVADTQKYMKE